MKLELRFFASVREALGTAAETVEAPAGVSTLGELRTWLRQRDDRWDQALDDSRPLRMACDQVLAHAATPLHEGAEVAFFPPVTGG